MKKIYFLFKVSIIFLMALMIITNGVVAAYDFSGTITNLDSHTGDTSLNTSATNIVGALISVIRIVATGVAIIMLLFVAMKYMISAPGDRAEIKKHAVIYVVGALVLFASSGILGIINNFASNI